MATIYRKTDRGRVEMETRVNRLAPRLRTALVLVDGVRSDADLHKLMLAEPDELLQALLARGYIEVVSGSAVQRASPGIGPVAVDVVLPIVPPA